jgi:hypothetical protein
MIKACSFIVLRLAENIIINNNNINCKYKINDKLNTEKYNFDYGGNLCIAQSCRSCKCGDIA